MTRKKNRYGAVLRIMNNKSVNVCCAYTGTRAFEKFKRKARGSVRVGANEREKRNTRNLLNRMKHFRKVVIDLIFCLILFSVAINKMAHTLLGTIKLT